MSNINIPDKVKLTSLGTTPQPANYLVTLWTFLLSFQAHTWP
jgi:hypothetical protein